MTRLLALFLLLAGCAAPPPTPAAAAARPRLFYVGLALYGEAWSRNDVAELADRLGRDAGGFEVVPTVLRATDPVEPATAAIARQARPGDVVMLYVSTHGSPAVLARDLGNDEFERVGPRAVRSWLAPLGGQPTVLVLSACFSGSFIPALQAPNRIVLTAARADRSSFGCQPDATHSVFGEALLGAVGPHESLRTIVVRTEQAVAARERRMGVAAPSEPQLSVGDRVAGLFAAELF